MNEWKAKLIDADGNEMKPPRKAKPGHHWINLLDLDGWQWREMPDLEDGYSRLYYNKEGEPIAQESSPVKPEPIITNDNWMKNIRKKPNE